MAQAHETWYGFTNEDTYAVAEVAGNIPEVEDFRDAVRQFVEAVTESGFIPEDVDMGAVDWEDVVSTFVEI